MHYELWLGVRRAVARGVLRCPSLWALQNTFSPGALAYHPRIKYGKVQYAHKT